MPLADHASRALAGRSLCPIVRLASRAVHFGHAGESIVMLSVSAPTPITPHVGAGDQGRLSGSFCARRHVDPYAQVDFEAFRPRVPGRMHTRTARNRFASGSALFATTLISPSPGSDSDEPGHCARRSASARRCAVARFVFDEHHLEPSVVFAHCAHALRRRDARGWQEPNTAHRGAVAAERRCGARARSHPADK